MSTPHKKLAMSKRDVTSRKARPSKVSGSAGLGKPIKSVFVIMPFTKTPSRNQSQLTAFFEDNIKGPVESGRFQNRYVVRRSDDSFNITARIIKDLYAADIVICDLSGQHANPNVMYELGIRLACSNRPVILIREKHPDNAPIFDIAGFYAEQYDPFNYSRLTEHVLDKLRRIETGEDKYQSPVLGILEQETPLIERLSSERAAVLLDILASSLHGTLRLLGGGVDEYLESKGVKVNLGGTPSESLELMAAPKNRKKLMAVDWRRFHFQPGSQPAIDRYLSSPYLHGLLPNAVVEAFTEHVLEYHAYFLSGNRFWGSATLQRIYAFTGETLIMCAAASLVSEALLLSESAERGDLLSQFTKVQLASNLDLMHRDGAKGVAARHE